MSNYVVADTQLTSIADAIRTKTGGTEQLTFPDGFTSAIGSITPKPSETSVTISGPAANTTVAVGGKAQIGTIAIERIRAGIKIIDRSSNNIFIQMPQDMGLYSHTPAVVYYINTGSSSQTVPQNSQGLSYKYFNS